MRNDNVNVHYFSTKADVAQNLIDDFFCKFEC